MKCFKTKASYISPTYEISHANFEKITENKYPFEQKNNTGTFSQYGICPSCLNPIQLIGVMHEIKCTPHGKHTGKDISELPQWNSIKYKYCPYATNNEYKEPNDNELLTELDDNIIELYDLLKTQFDRVVYIISTELDIQCDSKFWKKVLEQFLKNKVYFYPWLTEINLPYVFAYRGMHQQNICRQKFRVGSELYKILLKHPNVKFIKSEKEKNNYQYERLDNNGCLNLQFRFTKHKQKVSEGDTLHESMLFCIDDLSTGNTLYEKTIIFNGTFFMSIVNKKGNESKRQKWLLDIAEELMIPLKVK